jgi:hypothetical protein
MRYIDRHYMPTEPHCPTHDALLSDGGKKRCQTDDEFFSDGALFSDDTDLTVSLPETIYAGGPLVLGDWSTPIDEVIDLALSDGAIYAAHSAKNVPDIEENPIFQYLRENWERAKADVFQSLIDEADSDDIMAATRDVARGG